MAQSRGSSTDLAFRVVMEKMDKNSAGATPTDGKQNPRENTWVQVGRYSQLALVLPCATFVGWLIGTGLDRWLHTSWISVIGLILGSAAGLVEVIRTVQRDTK
jgi:F0F1-type ATP synthase assembly protein I